MKQVTITNATVVPQFKKKTSDPDQILKIYPIQGGVKNIVNFTISTPQKDGAVKSGRLYEKCSIVSNTKQDMDTIEKAIKYNALLNLQGYEESFRTTKGVYLRTVKVTRIKLLSEGINETEDIPIIGEE